MRELFRISKIDDKYLYLERDVSACGSCALSGKCSVQSVSTLKVEKDKRFDYFPGDFVVLDLKYRPAFLAFMLYGLPIIMLVVGIGLGVYLKLSDIYSFLIGLGFMSVSFLINKVLDKKFKPIILDVRHFKGG
ncbi:histidine kinase [Thermosipho melanesiensis]|uniref:Positive regulator of sigma E, RseC/MucC n=2 Tax=Thermosipho melanesiensis TaxID=46541 RepID=A6LJM2_THEM4|nr:SoxR reducing system RseC family protein [Thermosipho melanesiensis]ABR30123.1 positive regulator of sigma E, RseC/MucC [Thermosipho melanesiensis BI429]APT73320.1 histidine kinase [Thermosipho melanesiensis]OOC38710.1 histidine kinase [Thermosipho melanesiensis]OOC40514.1 histidine kinase [Thermosipho melanesiensis]OOC40779.1 histidine kinase [Thermosipho melanesiensis]